jgi:ABC-type glycerol-3-phosphate transport system permease component
MERQEGGSVKLRILIRANVLVAVMAIIAFAILVPFIWVILSAFKNNSEIFGESLGLPSTWRWENFATAWTEGNLGAYFGNSLFSAIMATAVGILVACPAGYAFAKLSIRRVTPVFYIYVFGLTLPIQTIMIPVFYQIKGYGLSDNIWGLILVLVGTGTPFAVFLMRGFYRDLPEQLSEAAKIDGASEWAIFVRIMLPLSKPGVLALAVFSFLQAWNEYLLALLLLTSDKSRTIPTGLVIFANSDVANYGPLFAGMVLAIVPSAFVYILLQRSFTQGLVAGSLK